MFEEYDMLPAFSGSETDQYLKRIGYSGPLTLTKQTLDGLVLAHQCSVPFETLDPHDFHMETDIHPDALFDKIVKRHRGGHCVELNKSFNRLLLTLGFDARPISCRVLLGTDEFHHPADHRNTLIHLNGRDYICDVGLGGPMAPGIVDIQTEEWQNFGSESYCIRPHSGGWQALCRQTSEKPDVHELSKETPLQNLLLFSTQTVYETDFVFLNHYMTTAPDALHVQHRILNMRTTDGYRSIMDDVYKENQGGRIFSCSVTGHLPEILEEKFGIIL